MAFFILTYVYLCTFEGLKNTTSGMIYNDTDAKLQFWFKILDFLMVNVMPVCVTFLVLIVSYFGYFKMGFGADAFQLLSCAW